MSTQGGALHERTRMTQAVTPIAQLLRARPGCYSVVMLVREPILVVGGGFGGLTTALALARRSYRTRVLEGAPEFGAIGYGIQFGPTSFMCSIISR